MKKQLSAVLAVLLFAVLVVPSAFSAGRWEKGVKLTGWYSNMSQTETLQWRTGVQTQIKRTDAFSVWDNGIGVNYGETIFSPTGLVTNMSPNNLSLYSVYVRNINAFTSWTIYAGFGSLYKPAQVPNPDTSDVNKLFIDRYYSSMVMQFSLNRTINRYLSLSAMVLNVKVIDPDLIADNSLGLGSVYTRPIGYRMRILWNLAFYKNLKGEQNEIISTLNYSYKLGKKLSLVFNSVISKKSDATSLWRTESLDLTYDLLYSGGSTY